MREHSGQLIIAGVFLSVQDTCLSDLTVDKGVRPPPHPRPGDFSDLVIQVDNNQSAFLGHKIFTIHRPRPCL
jgi:hypothetical protein